MLRSIKSHRHGLVEPAPAAGSRRGNILIISAVSVGVVLGFTVLVVDIGYIALVGAQLQAAADAAALAAIIEVSDSLEPSPVVSVDDAETAARLAAQEVAALHAGGDRNAIYLNPVRDLRFGQYAFDEDTGTYLETFGVQPYNLVEVTLLRNQDGSELGDGPLPLFFGPAIGEDSSNLAVTAAAALLPGAGFRATPTQTASILPITYDEDSYEDFLDGVFGEDDFTVDPVTREVSNGPDGIREFNVFPIEVTAGNRGLLNFSGGGANALKRQIEFGLNDADLQPFGGELNTADGPIDISGKPGINASIKTPLEVIKGLPRAIAIYSGTNNAPGANLIYTIVKFVGIAVVDVKLTGNPKRLILQPTTLIDSSVIDGDVPLEDDSIFTGIRLIR